MADMLSQGQPFCFLLVLIASFEEKQYNPGLHVHSEFSRLDTICSRMAKLLE